MYCDRDVSCIVIVAYHVLISVGLVSYVVSIQCKQGCQYVVLDAKFSYFGFVCDSEVRKLCLGVFPTLA